MEHTEFSLGVKETKGISIDFAALFMELLDKSILIILFAIICGLLAFVGCSTIINLDYESKTALYIMPQNQDSQATYVNLEVGSILTTDYLELITSRDLIEDAIEMLKLGDEENYESFVSKIDVENPTDTRIIYISVKDEDPYQARNIAVTLQNLAIEKYSTGMGIEGVTIFQKANLPTDPVHSEIFWAIIMAMLGFIGASVFVIVRYVLIDKIVSADDIESRLHYPVLGTIAYEKKYTRGDKNERLSD